MAGTLLIGDWQKAVEDELSTFATGLQDKLQVIGDVPRPTAPPAPDPGIIFQQLQGHAEQLAQATGERVAQAETVGRQLQDYASGLVSMPKETAEAPSQPARANAAPAERGGDLRAFARQAAQRVGVDPDIFERQIQQESGFSSSAKSGAGAQGIAQIVPQYHPGVDTSDPYASLEYAANLMKSHLGKYAGDYSKALAAYNAGGGAVDKYGGVPPFEETQRYIKTILGGAKQAVGGAVSAVGEKVPGPAGERIQQAGRDISQFGDAQLTNAEAYAACGPAAAVRFAQRLGRNPTLREALDLAKDVGWTQQQGMAGISSQKSLMDKLGVPTKLVPGAQWDQFAREAQSGNPVTISTSAHYFYADGYDPSSGAFHVGRSGTDLRGGKEWMTRAEIESAAQRLGGGNVQGALFADSPLVPAKSSAGTFAAREMGPLLNGEGIPTTGAGAPFLEAGDQAPSQTRNPFQVIGDAAGQGADRIRQGVGESVSGFTAPGGALEEITKPRLTGIGEALAPVGEAIANAPVLGGGLGMARGPMLLSDQELLQQAKPSELEIARDYASLFTDEPTDADVARALRGFRTGEAYAGERAGTAGRAARRIDYDLLARLRERSNQLELPDMPTTAPNIADRAVAFTVNNMLSNPASLLANAVGGVLETVKRPLVTAATGQVGGAGADLRAQGLAIGDALSNAGTAFTTGRRASRAADQPEAFEGLGGVVATPFLRAMGATDEFVHTLSSAGSQATELVRLMRAHPDLTQSEIMQRFGQQILEAGQRGGAEATFQTGGTGVGEALAGARRGFTAPDATVGERARGGAAQVLAPFSVVPDVLLVRGFKRIPGVNELITAPIEVTRALRAGDPAAAKRAAAGASLATLTNAAIWTQVQEGNITGSGPEDPAKKQALMNARDENGNPLWRPNSIRVGDQWVPYSSLGGVAVQLGAIANAVEQYEDAGKQVTPDVAKAFGSALGETITDAWYLQTVSGVFSAIRNGTLPEWMGGQALSTAGRAIPEAAALNAVKKYVDPVQREAEPKASDPRTWLEYFAARLPGASETVKPRLDPATGQPMEEPQTVASLLTRGTAPGEPSPVNEVLARHNLGVGDAPRTISPVDGLTIAITEEEQRRFTELAGPEVQKNVLSMSAKPSFQQAPADLRRDLLQEMISVSREVAALKLWQTLPREEQRRRLSAYEEAEKRQAEPSVRLR